MRFLCFLFLLLFAAAVGGFAYFNQEPVTVRFLQYELTSSLAAIAGAAYLLGMLSGWTVVGMVRRSARTVIDDVERRALNQRA